MHRYNVLMLRRLGKVSFSIDATAVGESHRFGDSLSVSVPLSLASSRRLPAKLSAAGWLSWACRSSSDVRWRFLHQAPKLVSLAYWLNPFDVGRLVHALNHPLLRRHVDLFRVQWRLGSRLLALVPGIHRAALSDDGECDDGGGENAKEEKGVRRFNGGHGFFFFLSC